MVRHKDDGCSGEKDVKTCPRDSRYDSLSNRLSILDRLLHTYPIWLQLTLSEEEAAEVLQSQPPGVRQRAARKQVEAGRDAVSLKRRTWSSRNSFQPIGSMVPGVYLGCSAGKFWKLWRQLPGPEPFTICLSVSLCPVAMESAGLSRKAGNLGNEEGPLARGPGPNFWRPDTEDEPNWSFWLPLLFYFHSEPGNLAETQPFNLRPNLQRFCSHRLCCSG